MLGKDANWVRNVRAAGGRAVLRRGGREQVRLEEVEPGDRAPILRRYLAVAPGARPHLPVDRRAPLAEFDRIAGQYPVFRIIPAAAGAAGGDGQIARAGVRGALELSAHMTVRPGQLEGFKRQAAECIRLTREKDTSRFHTCRPVYRGLARIAATVRSVHPAPVRCGFRFGSAADGHGIPASLRARVMRATLCPASRWANIHRTTGAVTGSGSSRCARRPHAACALSGAVRHQPAGTRTAGGRPGTGPAPGSGQPSRCGPGSGSG
jgi:hypothetical protein